MNKSQLFKTAHKIAKATVSKVGDYRVALKLALKEVWKIMSKKIWIAKGNTYKAKEDLKNIGFTWSKKEKRWESENQPDFEAWEKKYLNPTYNGARRARINAEAKITFEQI